MRVTENIESLSDTDGRGDAATTGPLITSYSGTERFVVPAIASACVLATWVVLLPRWFHFQQDDVWQYALARSEGFSWKFISVNGFEHFAPLTRIEIWIQLLISPYNIGLGIGMAIVLVGLLLASVMWLTDELDVVPTRRILIVVVGGLAMPLLSVASWNAQAIYIVPTLAATYAVMASHAHGLRTGLWRYHALAAACLLIAVGLQERGGVAVALTVLMDFFLLGRGCSFSIRVRRIWHARWPIVVLLVIAGTDAAIWRIWYIWPGQRHTSLTTGANVVASAFGHYLLPSLVGTHASLDGGDLWLVGGGVVAALAASIIYDRSALNPIGFFACTFIVYYSGLALGPLIVNGVRTNAESPQYLAYVVFPLLISLSLLGRQTTRTDTTVRKFQHAAQTGIRKKLVVVSAAAAILAGLLIVQDTQTLDRDFAYAPSMKLYLRNLSRQEDLWSSSARTILPLRVPQQIGASWVVPWAQEENFLNVIDPRFKSGPAQGGFSIIGANGNVASVGADLTAVVAMPQLANEASGTAVRVITKSAMCVSLVPKRDWLRIAVPHQDSTGRLFAALDYDSSGTTRFEITTVLASGSYQPNIWPSTLVPGNHLQVYPLDGRSFDFIQMVAMGGEARICVRGLAVLKPVIGHGDSTCSYVNAYGGSGPPAGCANLVQSTEALSRRLEESD